MLLFLTLTGCGRFASPPAPVATREFDETPTAAEVIDSPSMQYIPRQEQAPGWRLSEDPLVIVPQNLGRYLAQDARHFLQYEVIDLTVGQYDEIAGDGFAAAEIFRFPDFVKAFGAYSTRRLVVREFVQLGNEAFTGPNSLHIWSGPFYVRIYGRTEAAPRPESLVSLGQSIIERMPRAPGKPAIFTYLPEANRVPNSERFVIDSPLGQPALSNGFTAQFTVGEEQLDAVMVPTASRNHATQLLQHLQAFFTANGRLLDPIPHLGEDNFTAEDQQFGRAVAFRIDRFVVLFRGYGEMIEPAQLAIATEQRILNTIRQQLQAAEKQRLAAARSPQPPQQQQQQQQQPQQQQPEQPAPPPEQPAPPPAE
jgi:uncharacterized damage-inducible protein DinB